MAPPAEHQYEAVLALATKVADVLEATRFYLGRLGSDRGKSVCIVRRSHLGLFQPAITALVEEWRQREPAIFDESLRRAFAATKISTVIAALEKQPEHAIDAWDDGVRQLAVEAASLDRAVRAHLHHAQTELSIPGYELLAELGRGGFGAVYRARDAAGVERAVKVLAPSALAPQAHATERFRREGELLATLDHPGVVKYLQLVDGVPGTYLIMELIKGRRLSDWARDHDDGDRIEAVIEALDALHHLHVHDVIHRDLKPSNILAEDATNRIVIVDLGLAWLADGLAATMTQASTWSAAYAPPEVLADPRASRGPKHDIYSMGVVLYEILAGQRPLVANRVPLARHREELKPIDAVLDRALAPDEGRFATAAEFGAALRDARSGMESHWHVVFVAATQVQHNALRAILLEAAEQGARDNLAWVAIAVSGLADAIRIHYTRTYRIARGSDVARLERVLPATLSVAANNLFPGVTELCSEPVLAEDRYSEAAIARLGFSAEEFSIFNLAAQFVLDLAGAQDRGAEASQLPPPPPEILARGLRAVAVKLKILEETEPAIVRSLAELVAQADAK